MIPQPVLEYGLSITIGSLIGGITNHIAIWMLFHPHRPLRAAGFTLPFTPGLVPKRQPQIAQAVARAVSTHLVTSDALGRALTDPIAQEAVARRFEGHLQRWVERPVAETASGMLGGRWEAWSEPFWRRLEEWLNGLAEAPEVRAAIDAFLEERLREAAALPLHELLGPEGTDLVEGLLAQAVDRALGAEPASGALARLVEAGANHLLGQGLTLGELLGPETLGVIEAALARELLGRLPDVAEAHVRSADFRTTLVARLREQQRDWGFWAQRLAPEVEELADRIQGALEEEARLLPGRLREDARRDFVRAHVRAFLQELAAQPLPELVRRIGGADYDAGRQRVLEVLVAVLRAPGTARAVAAALSPVLREAWDTRLDSLLAAEDGPAREAALRRMAQALGHVLGRRDVVHRLLARAKPGLLGWIGSLRPADLMAADDLPWLSGVLTRTVLETLEAYAPELAATVDIHSIVEERVAAFPVATLEGIIRETSSRELRAITVIGFVLGGLVGAAQPWATRLLEQVMR